MTNHGYRKTERRAFTRMRLGIDVTVAVEGRPLGRYRTRDVDLGGVFVASASLELYPNDVAELGFAEAGGAARDHAFRARVVRHDDGGVALRFEEHDAASLAALRDVMTGAMPAADAGKTIRPRPIST